MTTCKTISFKTHQLARDLEGRASESGRLGFGMSDKAVEVYRNITKKCLSVKVGRLVKHRPDCIVLSNPVFLVAKAGRQKVIDSGVKNVHARVKGYALADHEYKEWMDYVKQGSTKLERVRYNPFKNETFMIGDRPAAESDINTIFICGVTGEMYAEVF